MACRALANALVPTECCLAIRSSDGRATMNKGHHHEEEKERREGRKGRRLSLSADPCENQGAGRLAGRDARLGPNSHQRGRPRSGRGGEMEKAVERDARGSGV